MLSYKSNGINVKTQGLIDFTYKGNFQNIQKIIRKLSIIVRYYMIMYKTNKLNIYIFNFFVKINNIENKKCVM